MAGCTQAINIVLDGPPDLTEGSAGSIWALSAAPLAGRASSSSPLAGHRRCS
jgi:hypothetical protein